MVNAERSGYHLEWTQDLSTYRKNPSVWPHCSGKNVCFSVPGNLIKQDHEWATHAQDRTGQGGKEKQRTLFQRKFEVEHVATADRGKLWSTQRDCCTHSVSVNPNVWLKHRHAAIQNGTNTKELIPSPWAWLDMSWQPIPIHGGRKRRRAWQST